MSHVQFVVVGPLLVAGVYRDLFSLSFLSKMFVIAELKSTVKAVPSLFSKGLADVAKTELNKKLANKVLHKSKFLSI